MRLAALAQRLKTAGKAWPLGRVEVSVTSIQDPSQTPSERFERRIVLGGPLDEAQRARLLEIAEMCPIHRLLTGGAEVSTALAGS